MKTYAVYLRPKSSSASPISSDTLFGAFCWAIWGLKGKGGSGLEKMLNEFNKSPAFILSSAFPYIQHGTDHRIRFFPKPLLPELKSRQIELLAKKRMSTKYGSLSYQHAIIEAAQQAKRFKSASYISEALLLELTSGKIDLLSLLKRFKKRGTLDPDIEWDVENILITTAERKLIDSNQEHNSFWGSATVQHNQIDRVLGSTVEGRLFFIFEETFMSDNDLHSGLWFIVRTEQKELLESILRYLEDTGIGGERTNGKGHFTATIEDYELPTAPDHANSFVCLSRYIPNDGECDFNRSPLYYSLSSFRPKHESKLTGLGHHIYKGLIRAFDPGSIFPLSKEQKSFYGRILPVGRNADKLGWPVWHNGMTIPLFLEVNDEI